MHTLPRPLQKVTGRSSPSQRVGMSVAGPVTGTGLRRGQVREPDGRYSAADDRTGTGLDLAPLLVTDRAQVTDDGSGLRSGPLP